MTTEANEIMAEVHDRMPVILNAAHYARWLSRDEAERPPLDLLRPFDAHQMVKRSAHPQLGNMRNQEPEMLNSE